MVTVTITMLLQALKCVCQGIYVPKLLDDLTKYEASYYTKCETISIPLMWLQPLFAYTHPYPHKHTNNMSLLKYTETWNSCLLNLSFPDHAHVLSVLSKLPQEQ